MGFFPDQEGEDVLLDLLQRHIQEISSSMVTQWAQEVAWSYMISAENEREQERNMIPAGYITEAGLMKYIGRERETPRIGFYVSGS